MGQPSVIHANIMIGIDGLKAGTVLSGCDSRDGNGCSAATHLSLTAVTLTWHSKNQTLIIYSTSYKKGKKNPECSMLRIFEWSQLLCKIEY